MANDAAEQRAETTADAVDAVTRAVEDYFLGWYDADPERMTERSIRSWRSAATSPKPTKRRRSEP